jgi:hypothetical protein
MIEFCAFVSFLRKTNPMSADREGDLNYFEDSAGGLNPAAIAAVRWT